MEKNKKWKLSIEISTIIVAIIAFIGSGFGTFLQGYYSQEQQKQEFESTLIIKAVETGNTKLSKNNLKFLLDAGLITDKNKISNLSRIVADPKYKITRGTVNQTSAYICEDDDAKKYHLSSNCIGLTNCRTRVEKVSLDEAKQIYHRVLCGYED